MTPTIRTTIHPTPHHTVTGPTHYAEPRTITQEFMDYPFLNLIHTDSTGITTHGTIAVRDLTVTIDEGDQSVTVNYAT